MQKSPFKFLDSFTKEDREIFFGRDKEIEELHSRVFESKILLVYGTSGTGKSSLINCGLANRFDDSDWLPVGVRRGKDINLSIAEALYKNALTKAPFEKAMRPGNRTFNLDKLLRSVYLDHFKPIFLILDQFEELFIFGSKEEKAELIRNVAKVIESEIQCRFIFSMREEYLAGVTEFEKVIPSFLANRMRIEKMTRHNAIATIEGPCRVNDIEVDQGFAESLLNKLNPDSPEVELTWLQVFLDKAFRTAAGQDGSVKKLTNELLVKLGDVKDILGSFLDEQITNLDDPENGLVVLKSFVSVKGTRNQVTENEVLSYTETFGKKIGIEDIRGLIQKFISLRILRDKDESDRYELRHDSLASKIFEKVTLVEKELLEVKYFIENAWLNYEKRKQLLSEDDLNYIAPYEDKLYLGEKYLSFIAHSRSAQLRSKRRRQNILIAAAAIIFIVLSLFTIWAMRERSNALIQQQAAETLKNEAVKAKDEADTARQEAITQRGVAESNANEALNARKQSDLARQAAVASREEALKQKSIAENLSEVASEQARAAERERQIADEQRSFAVAAEEKARRLSLLSTAQNLALRSMSMEKNPELMGLLAVQAFNFNINNGGPTGDPIIFKALDKAYHTLDSSKHSIMLFGSRFEMWSIVENKGVIFSSNMDGTFFTWPLSNKGFGFRPNSFLKEFVDFVSVSPDGNKLLLDFENNNPVLRRFKPESEPLDSELPAKAGRIKTAVWSDDSRRLVTGGKDSLIRIWDIGPGSETLAKVLTAPSDIRSIAICGSDSLISAQDDGSILLWSISDSASEILLSKGNETPLCIAWDKSKKTLLAGSSSGTILFINLNHKPFQTSVFTAHSAGIDHIVFSSDFRLVATSSWDKVIKLYDFDEFFGKGNSVGGSISFDNLNIRARSLVFTSDKKLVAGMSDATIRIWETSSQKLVKLICEIVKRNLTNSEWNDNVGNDIPYERTCNNDQ